jgi:hypothetical protein
MTRSPKVTPETRATNACIGCRFRVVTVGGVGGTAIRLSPVWDDPSAVVDLIRSAGPFWPLANYAASDAEMSALGRERVSFTPPWFRQDFARESQVLVPGAEAVLANARFAQGAGQLAGTDAVVRPQAVYVNIMAPTPFSFPPHLDIPAFRGFTRATQPVWLLKTMKTSGLFEEWRTKIATAVSWFYVGVGGDFHYWPDGADGSMAVERSPYGNVGVLADNEVTFHGVSALGDPGATMPAGLTRESRLVRGESGWAVHDADGLAQAHFSDDEVRFTVSWKADIFTNAEEAELHDSGESSLSLDTVVDLFQRDLAARGTAVHKPSDPLTDQGWIATLASTYQDPAPRMPPNA